MMNVQWRSVVLCTSDLTGSHGNDGTVSDNDGFSTIGQILRELLLNEQAVNPIVVQAAPERRNLVIADQRQLRMQDRSTYILSINIGIINLQDTFHRPAKIAKSAILV